MYCVHPEVSAAPADSLDSFAAWAASQTTEHDVQVNEAWEALTFPGQVLLEDRNIAYLDWPLAVAEVRELLFDGTLTEKSVWEQIMDKASRIRQPHLYEVKSDEVAN